MKKLTAEQVQAEIKRRNELFKGRKAAEKRVLIAKDVLQLIDKKQIVPLHGAFVSNDLLSDQSYEARARDGVGKNESVQPLLLQNKCECCALGAMMVSCTLFNNREKLSDFRDNFQKLGSAVFEFQSLKNSFDKIFSQQQLAQIEFTFEWKHEVVEWNNRGYIANEPSAPFITTQFEGKSLAFAKENRSPRARLIAIMQNIIENNGTFKL